MPSTRSWVRLFGLLPRRELLLSSHTACRALCTTILPQGDVASGNSVVADPGVEEEVLSGGHHQVKSLSLPTVHLPTMLQQALTNSLSEHPSRRLTEDGQAMARYLDLRRGSVSSRREGRGRGVGPDPEDGEVDMASDDPVVRYGKREVAAYAASRLSAVYGVTLRVLNEIAQREPSFHPGTMLDFGSGLGSAMWAAHQTWGESLYEYCSVDTSQDMGEMAARLRRGGKRLDPEMETGSQTGSQTASEVREAIPGVHFRQFLPASDKVKYDLVVSAYTLGDMPTERLKRMSITSLWRKTLDFMVLIEPGNWSGYESIMQARDLILNATKWGSSDLGVVAGEMEGMDTGSLKGYVFAPCPHDLSCPLRGGSRRPCHFAQRVQLAYSERESLKHKACRIEHFSYLVLRKGQRPSDSSASSSGRLLQPVRKRTRHIICQLCCPTGETKEVILTKGKHSDLYRRGRRSEWGDLLPLPDTKTGTAET